ncbi:hypothetical protein CBS101457_002344 [Exobasidium rhododendri]|nr:hypothetical protein CBS101457_002344 [Exobasidium rhododendri]
MPREPKVKASEAAAGSKAKKAKKDPNAPKRPLSAYMFFSQDHREKVRTENATASFGEIGRLLGAKWKEMEEADKKLYHDMAARDKIRAEDEKATYKASGGGASAASTKKKPASKKAAPVAKEDSEEEEESD